jgi:hypothetical protein
MQRKNDQEKNIFWILLLAGLSQLQIFFNFVCFLSKMGSLLHFLIENLVFTVSGVFTLSQSLLRGDLRVKNTSLSTKLDTKASHQYASSLG